MWIQWWHSGSYLHAFALAFLLLLLDVVLRGSLSLLQVAVNSQGKTNEATKNVNEPLQKGQTAPKDDIQQKQEKRKSKGMKV